MVQSYTPEMVASCSMNTRWTSVADSPGPSAGLMVQRQTVGEFVPTTEINLGLNLPSSATPITAAFNKDKPETYHKTTSFTTYGANGRAQLATIYYVKTANRCLTL